MRPLEWLRSRFNQIEASNLPLAAKSVARFMRRASRRPLLLTRKAMQALSPLSLRRHVLYPVRNLLYGGQPLEAKVGRVSFFLVPKGVVPRDMWAGGYFERTELEFILDVLEPGMIFVDVGANVGFYSIPAARKVQHGSVFAFEPCSWTYRTLVENAKINKLVNLTAVHSALSDHQGQATLQVNVSGKDGLNTLGRPTHVDCDVVATEPVQVTTLDSFLLERRISSVDVIKIDVEGAELFVLKGATNLLSRPDAPLILYESGFLTVGFDYHPVEQMWFLEKLGYVFYVIDPVCGKISRPANGHAYDAMIIALKASHSFYPILRERLV